MRIAVIDDDPDMRFLIAFPLTAHHDVLEFTDGEDAMEYDDWGRVDVAIIDAMMPRKSGAEVLVWLSQEYPRVRRIICSAMGDDLDSERFALAHDVVSKPFSQKALESAING